MDYYLVKLCFILFVMLVVTVIEGSFKLAMLLFSFLY